MTTPTTWDERQADELQRVLQQRGIDADRPMLVAFVTGMVDLVADTAGVTADTARATISPSAIERWADSLTPHGAGSDAAGPGHVLVPAGTMSAGMAALLAVLGQPGTDRDAPVWRRASAVAVRTAAVVLEQTEQDVLRIPSPVYEQLGATLDQVLLQLSRQGGAGQSAGQAARLHDIVAATLHELDLVLSVR